jgi:perosamine synthetase
MNLGSTLTKVLEDVLVESIPRPIALHEPEVTAEEEEYVLKCVKSGWLSSVGSYVEKFESELCSLTGAQHAVAMASGTSALQLALYALGVKPGDEVLVPALSFVATANAVAHCGAVPHFVDVDETNLAVDPQLLARHLSDIATQRDGLVWNRHTGRRLAAIVPVHVLGLAADVFAISRVALDFQIPMLEDAAEAVGTTINGRHCGTLGVAGMLSFNGNKTITTGNGGAVITSDSGLAQRLRHISSTAKKPHPWRYDHDEIGWNYRLPNLNAALGCAQLKRLDSILERKRILHQNYKKAFEPYSCFNLFNEHKNTRSNYWLSAVRISGISLDEREQILTECHAHGFMCRPLWTLLPDLPMFRTAPTTSLNAARLLEREVVCLPSGPRLAISSTE